MIDCGLDGYKQEFNKEDSAGIKVKGDNRQGQGEVRMYRRRNC